MIYEVRGGGKRGEGKTKKGEKKVSVFLPLLRGNFCSHSITMRDSSAEEKEERRKSQETKSGRKYEIGKELNSIVFHLRRRHRQTCN